MKLLLVVELTTAAVLGLAEVGHQNQVPIRALAKPSSNCSIN